MNRIDSTLKEKLKRKKKCLSPYIVAGDPALGQTVPLMHALVKAGADIIELGMPFSDPMAEGHSIQSAVARAIDHGITLDNVFSYVKAFREQDDKTPVVLMGYLNSIEQYGYQHFATTASNLGVDGTIIVDLPPEESHELVSIWKSVNLYPIFLCSPTTSPARMKLIQDVAQGYVYYVSLKGITGSDSIGVDKVAQHYKVCKNMLSMPLMVGFGIKTPAIAAIIAEFSDGIVVGSALIDLIQENSVDSGVGLIAAMRQAIDE